uniref:Uncharacterized protein n=1 Tax=Anguilla anguilla TaxID=7936 RepID=A0A0E9S975_ANGAN
MSLSAAFICLYFFCPPLMIPGQFIIFYNL